MAELKNYKHEMFSQHRVVFTQKEAYLKVYPDAKNPSQNAYNLVKNNPKIEERIEELKLVARSDARKEVNDYIKFYDDITFCRGEFSLLDAKPKLEQRMTASTKAMKAQGFEGEEKVNITGSGGYQLVIHNDTKEEETEEKDEAE